MGIASHTNYPNRDVGTMHAHASGDRKIRREKNLQRGLSHTSGAEVAFKQKLDAGAPNRLPSHRDPCGRAGASIGVKNVPALFGERRCGRFLSLRPQ